MTDTAAPSLIAVDVGNSRIKFGVFAAPPVDQLLRRGELPDPTHSFTLPTADWTDAQLLAALRAALDDAEADAAISTAPWAIASVNPAAAERLVAWIETRGAASQQLALDNIPIRTLVTHPERTGVDRLLAAVAANQLRDAARPAIIVDVGSAITVDLVTVDGSFAGGAILPGVEMSARALHDQTAQLPKYERRDLTAPPPPALGNSTDAAIDSGLFWGAIGAVRELIARLAADQPNEPHVYLTGGAAPAIADLLRTADDTPTVRHVPHLVLSGIAIALRSTC